MTSTVVCVELKLSIVWCGPFAMVLGSTSVRTLVTRVSVFLTAIAMYAFGMGTLCLSWNRMSGLMILWSLALARLKVVILRLLNWPPMACSRCREARALLLTDNAALMTRLRVWGLVMAELPAIRLTSRTGRLCLPVIWARVRVIVTIRAILLVCFLILAVATARIELMMMNVNLGLVVLTRLRMLVRLALLVMVRFLVTVLTCRLWMLTRLIDLLLARHCIGCLA